MVGGNGLPVAAGGCFGKGGILAGPNRGARTELPLAHHAGIRGGGVWCGLRVEAFDGVGSYREIAEDRGAAQLDEAFSGGAFKVADSEDGLRRAVDVDVHAAAADDEL